MVWHIKKTSILGQIQFIIKVITVGLKTLKNVPHIPLKQKQKRKIIYGEEANGMSLLSMKDNEKFY